VFDHLYSDSDQSFQVLRHAIAFCRVFLLFRYFTMQHQLQGLSRSVENEWDAVCMVK
jgi:hypothetical protein